MPDKSDYVKVSGCDARARILSEAGMLESLGRAHAFLPDGQTAAGFPDWCQYASRTTDAHLMSLAHAHGAELATLDEGIPKAFLIPEPSRR